MNGWTTDLKLAVAEIRRLRATANLLKWSTNLMKIQTALVDTLPADHPNRAKELQMLKEFVQANEGIRGVVPKRPGGAR